MKKLEAPNSLIGYADLDEKICDDLLEFYKNDTMFHTVKGVTANEKNPSKDIKESFDKNISANCADKTIYKYLAILHEFLNNYRKLFPTLSFVNVRISDSFNIQKYPKDAGYVAWHCERMNSDAKTSLRVLSFITYLNDVDVGGETEFALQQRRIKAKKGRTIIFPSEWSHLHRGVPSPNQEKYITAGWFELV